MSVEKSSSFNPNHPLCKFRKEQRKLNLFLYIMIACAFVLIPSYLYEYRNVIDKTDAIRMGITFYLLLISILFLAYYNIKEKKRTRYHRYYGPTNELLNILEGYFHKMNLSYIKNKKFTYKYVLSLKSVDAIKYEFNDLSIVILPLESIGSYCELFIQTTTPQIESTIENIERDIFVLIEKKRRLKHN